MLVDTFEDIISSLNNNSVHLQQTDLDINEPMAINERVDFFPTVEKCDGNFLKFLFFENFNLYVEICLQHTESLLNDEVVKIIVHDCLSDTIEQIAHPVNNKVLDAIDIDSTINQTEKSKMQQDCLPVSFSLKYILFSCKFKKYFTANRCLSIRRYATFM